MGKILEVLIFLVVMVLIGCHRVEHCAQSHKECICFPVICSYAGEYVHVSEEKVCDRWEPTEVVP